MKRYITSQIHETQRVMSDMLTDEALLACLEAAAKACMHAFKSGKRYCW